MYRWQFYNAAAEKQFRELDRPIQRRLVVWLDTHLIGTSDPRVWGRALEGPLGTLWRYRVGDYRIVVSIDDNKFLVLVVKTGRRASVYRL